MRSPKDHTTGTISLEDHTTGLYAWYSQTAEKYNCGVDECELDDGRIVSVTGFSKDETFETYVWPDRVRLGIVKRLIHRISESQFMRPAPQRMPR